MNNCQRCGSTQVSWSQDETLLFGGVYCFLCVECKTEWDGLLRETPEWIRFIEYEARYRAYVSSGEAQEAAHYLVLSDEISRGIFKPLALEFVKRLDKPLKKEPIHNFPKSKHKIVEVESEEAYQERLAKEQ